MAVVAEVRRFETTRRWRPTKPKRFALMLDAMLDATDFFGGPGRDGVESRRNNAAAAAGGGL